MGRLSTFVQGSVGVYTHIKLTKAMFCSVDAKEYKTIAMTMLSFANDGFLTALMLLHDSDGQFGYWMKLKYLSTCIFFFFFAIIVVLMRLSFSVSMATTLITFFIYALLCFTQKAFFFRKFSMVCLKQFFC